MAADTAYEIAELLPDGDLVEELRNLLSVQMTIFDHIIQGKHYGSDHLTEFMKLCQKLKDEITKMGESNR